MVKTLLYRVLVIYFGLWLILTILAKTHCMLIHRLLSSTDINNMLYNFYLFKQKIKALNCTKNTLFSTSNMLCTWIKTGMSASIPDTKAVCPWNIHHKYPRVHSVGWMPEEVNEEVVFLSFPLMGANRITLRVIACGTGKRQQQHSYTQALPLGGY